MSDLLSSEPVTLYVRLLDEGIMVARPTLAVRRSETQYRLLPTPDYDSEVETWEFLPGEVVVAEQ